MTYKAPLGFVVGLGKNSLQRACAELSRSIATELFFYEKMPQKTHWIMR